MRFSNPAFCSAALACLVACGGGGGRGGEPAPHAAVSVTEPAAETETVAAQSAAATQIQLLALYTDGVSATTNDPDLRIRHLVNVANDVLADNGVSLEFVLGHVEWVSYPDDYPITQALDDLTFGSHASVAHIAAVRDENAADLVVLFRPYANDGQCGYAWIGAYQQDGDFSHPQESDFGYSVVASNCSDYTLLHELGHNLGLAHSRRADPAGGSFRYGAGYGLDNDFATVMASPVEFNASQLPQLSTPLRACNGSPCGIEHSDEDAGADAVRAVTAAKDQVAAYR